MGARTLSLWTGVPEAESIRTKLAAARDPRAPAHVRQDALTYLSGCVRVLATLEKRQALAEYLREQIQTLRKSLYYTTRGFPA